MPPTAGPLYADIDIDVLRRTARLFHQHLPLLFFLRQRNLYPSVDARIIVVAIPSETLSFCPHSSRVASLPSWFAFPFGAPDRYSPITVADCSDGRHRLFDDAIVVLKTSPP